MLINKLGCSKKKKTCDISMAKLQLPPPHNHIEKSEISVKYIFRVFLCNNIETKYIRWNHELIATFLVNVVRERESGRRRAKHNELIAVEAKNDLWTNCCRNCERSRGSHPLTPSLAISFVRSVAISFELSVN